MTTKVLEVRDHGTCILALAIRMESDNCPIREWFIHYRSGYPRDGSSIMLMRLADGKATNDPYEWPAVTRDNRTMPVAHHWIIDHWDQLADGDVVDTAFILNETDVPKRSERVSVELHEGRHSLAQGVRLDAAAGKD